MCGDVAGSVCTVQAKGAYRPAEVIGRLSLALSDVRPKPYHVLISFNTPKIDTATAHCGLSRLLSDPGSRFADLTADYRETVHATRLQVERPAGSISFVRLMSRVA